MVYTLHINVNVALSYPGAAFILWKSTAGALNPIYLLDRIPAGHWRSLSSVRTLLRTLQSLALNANELRLRSRSRYGRLVSSACVPPPRRPVVDRAEAAWRRRKEGTGSVKN